MERELKAREHLYSKLQTHEIGLEHIYAELQDVFPEERQREAAIQAELAVEKKHIFPNKPVIDLLQHALQQGKKVIVVSDTYFSTRDLKKLLPIKQIKKIYCSSEFGKGKANGLFDLVVEDLSVSPDEIAHCGDNYESDVRVPGSLGIHTVLMPNGTGSTWQVYAQERKYRSNSLTEDDYKVLGLITASRNSAMLEAKPGSEYTHFIYGCVVLGPIFHSYLRWVADNARELKAPAVVGLMREGGFLVDLLREISPEIETRNLYVSRLCVRRLGLRTVSASSLKSLVPVRQGIPLSAYAKRIGLSWTDFPLEWRNQIVSQWNPEFVDAVVNFILNDQSLKKRVASEARAFEVRMRQHVSSVLSREGLIGDDGPTLLIDLGWAGSIQKHLTQAFDLDPASIIGLYLALNDLGIQEAAPHRLGGFIFDGFQSHPLAHVALAMVEILEQSATPDVGSTIDYLDGGKPVLAQETLPQQQRRERKEIQEGIVAYVKTAEIFFKNLPVPTETYRSLCTAIFIRSGLFPTEAEKHLFENWHHDDSFADGAVDALVPSSHRHLAKYMTPAQLLWGDFLSSYWPVAAHETDVGMLAEHGNLALMTGSDPKIFERESGVSLELRAVDRDGQEVSAGTRSLSINSFGRSFATWQLPRNCLGDVLLEIRSTGEAALNLELLHILPLGRNAAGEGLMLSGDALAAKLLRQPDGKQFGHLYGSTALIDDGFILHMKLAEDLERFDGTIQISLGCSLWQMDSNSYRSLARASDASAVRVTSVGYFDVIAGRKAEELSSTSLGVMSGNGSFSFSGWCFDKAHKRAPTRVSLELIGEHGTVRFPGRVYPRPDLSRGFGFYISGMAGCHASAVLHNLPLGRYRVCWVADFGAETQRVFSPYAVDLNVGEENEFECIVRDTSQE